MQVSNGQIWQAGPALQELIKERWPVKTAYWLTKLARKVGEHLRDIEAVRKELFQQYGTLDEESKQLQVRKDSEQWLAFEAAYNELMNEQTEIDLNKIILPEVDGACLKPETLLVLEPFVEIAE